MHAVANFSAAWQAVRWWTAARVAQSSTVAQAPLQLQLCTHARALATAAAYEPSVVFVLGAPGAGKSTQCERLVHEFGFAHLSAGQLLRDAIAEGREGSAQLQAIIQAGQIVPAHVCFYRCSLPICFMAVLNIAKPCSIAQTRSRQVSTHASACTCACELLTERRKHNVYLERATAMKLSKRMSTTLTHNCVIAGNSGIAAASYATYASVRVPH